MLPFCICCWIVWFFPFLRSQIYQCVWWVFPIIKVSDVFNIVSSSFCNPSERWGRWLDNFSVFSLRALFEHHIRLKTFPFRLWWDRTFVIFLCFLHHCWGPLTKRKDTGWAVYDFHSNFYIKMHNYWRSFCWSVLSYVPEVATPFGRTNFDYSSVPFERIQLIKLIYQTCIRMILIINKSKFLNIIQ